MIPTKGPSAVAIFLTAPSALRSTALPTTPATASPTYFSRELSASKESSVDLEVQIMEHGRDGGYRRIGGLGGDEVKLCSAGKTSAGGRRASPSSCG
ncbi:unnamed protein product [Linum trigynum]|uniref:Secreted protein n=1 Tax=Linum trigynum TaxID=586398 RepID=A0AAV2CVL5_9ROSI